MGLAKTVAARFPGWGGDFSTLMVRYPALPLTCPLPITSQLLLAPVATAASHII